MSGTPAILDDPSLAPVPSVEAIQRLRQQLGTALQPAQALALLELGESGCALLISEGLQGHPTPVVHHMHLGVQLLAQRTFKKAMPTEAQLEAGIMVVEDAVMPLQRLVPAHSVLATRDPLLRDIARHATGSLLHGTPAAVSREAIEALFSRLASQASRPYGGPDPDLPQQPTWAAALLILREALHHWQFEQMSLLPAAP